MRKTICLGDMATYINGYAFKPVDWGTKGLPIIRIQNLTDSGKDYNYYDGEIKEKYLVKKGDVLISWSASIGVFEWEKEDAWLNQHIFKVVFDKKEVNKQYFKYVTSYVLKKSLQYAHGSTMKHLTKSTFDKLPIPIYDLNVQRVIAEKIGKVDEAIAECDAMLADFDLLVKSRFIEMFGDFHTNSMNWPVKKFIDCATIESNMIHDFTGFEDYPHIGIDSIEKNTGVLSGYRTVREDGIISGKYLFTAKHIIYSKIRPNLNKVALPNFEGVCSADAYSILPNEEICNRIFLAHVMRSSVFLDYILPFSNRTNMPKVNRKQVEGFSCPIPPVELQNQFADFVALTDKSKLIIQKSLDDLQELRDSLLQEYFG